MSYPPSGSSSEIVESSKSSSSPLSGKVCIVSTFWTNKFYYAVFIIDLENSPSVNDDDDQGFVPSAPTILLDLGPGVHYVSCLIKSTLYFFEEYLPACALPPYSGRSVYTYDLSQISTTKSRSPIPIPIPVVDKTMLSSLPNMFHTKMFPYAIPTPDGNRILVFSSQIDFDPFINDHVDFELYTLNNREWKELPSLKNCLIEIDAKPFRLYVDSWAFISNSVFVIQIKFGIFTLDVDEPVPVWNKYSDCLCDTVLFFDVIEDGALYLTYDGAYDISNGVDEMFDHSKLSDFPYMPSFGTGFKYRDRISYGLKTVYDGQGNAIGFLKSSLAINKRIYRAHMILEVCSFDLKKYRNGKKNGEADVLLETKLIKSFKFVMDEYKCDSFFAICLSPI